MVDAEQNQVKDLAFSKQDVWTFGPLPDTDLPAVADGSIVAGESYLSITLHAQRIRYGRKLATSYFPAVRAFATVPRVLAQSVEFSTITTPSQLEAISKADLGRVILGEQPLLGPIAYWGPIKLAVALHAIPAGDLADGYLALLTDLSRVGGGWFAMAAAVAGPLKQGIAALTGTDDESLEVGYAVGRLTPRPGYYAVVAASRLDLAGCSLRQGRLTSGSTEVDAPFFVFSIEGLNELPEWWAAVPGLIETWAKVRVATTEQALSDGEQQCRALIASSHDLTGPDRTRARAHISAYVKEMRDELLGAGVTAAPVPGSPTEVSRGRTAGGWDLRRIRLSDPVDVSPGD